MNVAWWCSGVLGQRWEWTWQPFLGAWLLTALLVAGYALARRRLEPPALTDVQRSLRRRRTAAFLAGVAVLWLASDWPLAPLGAGYLASVAMLRYLLYTLVAAPLLVLGLPPSVVRRALRPRGVRTVLRGVTHPLVALIQSNVVLVVTHLPPVVDTMKTTQLGSFTLDMLWLVSALILWWPVLSPVKELPRLSSPVRMAYLFGQSIVPTVPASFLTFATFPLYELYELAPRVSPLDPVVDQRLAGLEMKILGGFLLWGVIAGIWFRWAAREEGPQHTPARMRDFERELEAFDLRA